MKFDDNIEDITEMLPEDVPEVKAFQQFVRDPTYYMEIEDIWAKWNKLAEDPGSRQLSDFVELRDIFKSDPKKDSKDQQQDFPLTYLHLTKISEGVTILKNHKFVSEDAIRSIDEEDVTGDNQRANELKKFGAKMKIASGKTGQSKDEVADKLIQDLKKYANKMSNITMTSKLNMK